ncbi:MAG: flippase-like domain-containing protein, partial [Nitrospirota bacterium]
MEQKSNKKRLFLVLKFAVSSAFLYFVLKKAGAGNVVTHLFSVDPLYFLAAVVVYIIATYISAVRWKLFLDEDIGLGRLFSLYMIGTFFNNVMPGMVGGDAVKAYYLYSDTKRGGSSLGSVFMDRYSGLFALLSIGLVTSMFVLDELGEIGMQWAMPLLFGTFIIGTAVVLGLRAGRRVKVVGEFYDHFIRYLRNREVMVKTFLLSIVIQLLAILMIYFIILGMGQSPSFISLFVFMP